jgi:hypothetical protein
MTLLQAPNVETLAKILEACIERAERPVPSSPSAPPSAAPEPEAAEPDLRELLLWERERRLEMEAMLHEMSAELQRLRWEVECTRVELRALNNELQEMALGFQSRSGR